MKSDRSVLLRPLAAAVSCLLATTVAAQSTQPTVLVTATRTPVTVDQALASVSVIERADIESAGALDLVSLLRREAGLDIVRGGGVGQQTSIFLRGANSNQLLVLIDGVRAASATTGSYGWEHLPLQQIERIEIVRGPRAALYGSDAIGGVIQIFTRRSTGPSGAIGVGSHDTRVADAGFGRQTERMRFGVRASVHDTEGFSAQNPDGFSYDPDRDGSTQRTLSADAGAGFAGVRLDAQLLASERDVEFDQGESDVRQRNARIALSGGRQVDWLLAAGHARETLETPTSESRLETRRTQLDWQQAHPVGDGELLWGLGLVDEYGASIDTGADEIIYNGDRDHRAVFGSWRDSHAAWSWELAARHDDYEGFGEETSGQAALGWRAAEHSRLRLSVAEGFRAPNLNELYSPGFFGGLFAGNPALGPERSRAWELGSAHQLGRLSLDLRVYRNRVRNLIDFSGGDTFQAINIGRARLQGAEAEWRWVADDWLLAGNLGWQQATNLDSGAALLRRAPRKASIRAEHALGRGVAGIELQAVSARPDFGGELPGYAVASGYLRWPLSDRLELDLRLENLADRDYQTLRGFNTAGLGGLLQLRWHGGG